MLQESYEVPKLALAKRDVPQLQKQPDCLDQNESIETVYSVSTEANVSLRPSSMNQIKVSIRDEKGFPAPKGVRYEIEGGCILPGVVVLQGIMEQRDTIAVLNLKFDLFDN